MKIFHKPKDFRNLALGITLDLVKGDKSWGPSDILEHAMLVEAYLSGRLRYDFLKNPSETGHTEVFVTDVRPVITDGLISPHALPAKSLWSRKAGSAKRLLTTVLAAGMLTGCGWGVLWLVI